MPETVPVPIVLSRSAILPQYQTAGSAGMDLCCAEEFELRPMERKRVGTGLRIAVPIGYEAQVRPRSGLAFRHGITMVNSPGTIDSDFRGEIQLIMINLGESVVTFHQGDRVGQLVLSRVERVAWEKVAELDETDRGDGGFGSTGV